jgi:metallo-beta-lactamase family protein
VKITDIFKLHPECLRHRDARGSCAANDSPFEFDEVRYVDGRGGQQGHRRRRLPAIIISASGMCEAGRILHHLKSCIEDEEHRLIVGYQAQHTLGRRLVEQRSRVRIFGVERDRRAEVVVLNGFSAHADQRDLRPPPSWALPRLD